MRNLQPSTFFTFSCLKKKRKKLSRLSTREIFNSKKKKNSRFRAQIINYRSYLKTRSKNGEFRRSLQWQTVFHYIQSLRSQLSHARNSRFSSAPVPGYCCTRGRLNYWKIWRCGWNQPGRKTEMNSIEKWSFVARIFVL